MKTYKEELREFVEIYEYIDDMEKTLLYGDSKIDKDEAYQMLYDKAFSDEVNGRLQKIFPFDWFDIDASYAEDYNGWKHGLEDAVEKVKSILKS
jgi:hypothetical protein